MVDCSVSPCAQCESVRTFSRSDERSYPRRVLKRRVLREARSYAAPDRYNLTGDSTVIHSLSTARGPGPAAEPCERNRMGSLTDARHATRKTKTIQNIFASFAYAFH